MEFFSQRLKWLRDKHGFSQREMAEKLGISQTYYGKFETNKGEPNLETLIKLPDIFRESLDFILGAVALDDKGYELLHRYYAMRRSMELKKERLERNIKTLNEIDGFDVENKLDTIQKIKKKYMDNIDDYHNSFKTFVDYIKTIPCVSEKLFEESFWEPYYQQDLQRYKRSDD